MQKLYFNDLYSGWWQPSRGLPDASSQALGEAILGVNRPLFVVNFNGKTAIAQDGTITIGDRKPSGSDALPLMGYVPALHPKDLGDPGFKQDLKLRYAYVAGAMANGITSVEMVEEAGRNGMIGFFGAAGLLPKEIESAIVRLQESMESRPFGFNLIHSPGDPALERATVDLYLRHNIKLVSASAYLDLTLPLVYFRLKGIHRNSTGNIVCPNKIIAKVSRVEVARKFFTPPPEKYLRQLLDQGMISHEQAAMAAVIPMTDDLTAEADSGGHTDNRPALTLLPTMLALRDEVTSSYNCQSPVRIGLAGGIATPESTAAAFAMGAAYVLTGSINQACLEAGTSDTVRRMLAEADQADVTMAPAADMFELGVKVQVLKRGTMFPLRAAKLYELYRQYDSYEMIPSKQREILQRDFFKCSFSEEWEQTRQFFAERDPQQIELAEQKPKHKMALVFRSYLGRSSNWANTGDPTRKIDYQIWCGPAMGAFNHWTKGTFLEKSANRKTVTVAMNLLFGAAVTTRLNWLRLQGIALPQDAVKYQALELAQIQDLLDEQM
ncbi:Enoyl-[acyl-carrier-protein] reductase [FMN] (EC, inferred for PFA pathway [Olavius sp. associated proteobacterium Delta 1]|nr:Enoyl-[acyl-carrier-protein] reductase [FMN] (EC, inferred for PFA pathway [Olavius sp. associated proteobacterium Delta 1]